MPGNSIISSAWPNQTYSTILSYWLTICIQKNSSNRRVLQSRFGLAKHQKLYYCQNFFYRVQHFLQTLWEQDMYGEFHPIPIVSRILFQELQKFGSLLDCPNEQHCKAELHSLYKTVHLYKLDNSPPPASWALLARFAQLAQLENLLLHTTRQRGPQFLSSLNRIQDYCSH